MKTRSQPCASMQVATAALIRCETLDLFGPPAAVLSPPIPAPAEVEPADADPPWSGLLFRIGPDDQLDLFRHSPAQMAAARARRALGALDTAAARQHLSALSRMPDFAAFLADCEHCIELIERRDPRWTDPVNAVPWLESVLQPAAERCLQGDASLLTRPAWHALLEHAGAPPFDSACRHAHPSYLWQALGETARAISALEQDPRWRQQADALLWHAELCEQAQWSESLAADLLELCLDWPDDAEVWLSSSRTWSRRWANWCDLDDALPMQAFPAWCRLTRGVDFPLPPDSDQRPGAQWLRLAHQLVRDGQNLALRKTLKAQCPALLAAWLAERPA